MPILPMGAIDTATNQYHSPSEALKGKTYKCTDCGNRVIYRKGDVRIPHFAHYSQTNTCSYYDHPSESQIHKDAKLLMAKLLTEKKNIQFVWPCDYPPCYKTGSDTYAFSEVPTITYKEGDEVVLEYRDKDNKWVADVAVINNGLIRFIIEIKHTHGTGLGRPEPWFEVDATTLIQEINELHAEHPNEPDIDIYKLEDDYIYLISCERKNIKRYCYGSFCYKEYWVNRIPGYDKKLLVNECILCGTSDFSPITDGCTGKFQSGGIKVCMDCLVKDTYEKKLPALYSAYLTLNKMNCGGQCFIQGDNGGYKRSYCSEDCKLVQCLKCPNKHPIWLLNCRGGWCPSCYGSTPYTSTFINVPFERKDEAKSLGAKWDADRKKWFIDKDHLNYKQLLLRFKKC
jgi:hypothetical protein